MGILDNEDEYYMQQALREARMAADEDEVPIGAVVVMGGEELNPGDVASASIGVSKTFTAAAEHVGGKYLQECTLYVTVEPCPMCAGAAGWTQVGRIVYGAADPKRGYKLLSGQLLHPKTEVTGGVLADECGALVKEFFRKKR